MAVRNLATGGLTIPPAAAVNAAASARGLAAAGARALVPVTYGIDRQPALLLNVLAKAGDANTLLVQCLWGHALHQVDQVQLNDQTLPAGSTVTTYTGSQTTADAVLVAAFAAQGITYTDTLAGYAYSVLAMPTRSFDGQLNVAGRLYGRKVYDPRKDSTAGGSGSHRLADATTWEWTDNPSLCLADWCASTLYGAGDPVLWSSVPAAADANDALVGSPSEKRRLLGVTLSRDGVSVGSTAEALRTYAGCWLVPTGSGLRLLPDADAAPAASYSHALGQIARLDALQLRDLGNTPTAVEVKYTDTSQTPWREASVTASVAGAGTTKPWRISSVSLPGVQRHSQANREAIERLNKLNLGDLSTSLEVFDAGIAHDIGDIITITHPVGLSSKPMRVTDVDMPSAGRVRLAVTEHDPAGYSTAVVAGPSIADTNRTAAGGPVSQVASFAGAVSKGRITWVWAPAADAGYAATELRTSDANWGAISPPPAFRGAANTWGQVVSTAGTVTLYARHFDVLGNSSATAVQASVPVISGDLVQDGAPGDPGDPGDPGPAGLSVAEINTYIRSASAPSAPSGGSFNFSSQTLTPPSGWSVGVPSGTDPVYVARGLATTSTPGATVTPTWGGAAAAFSDGQAVDVVFIRSATPPNTPPPSIGVPAGWYGTVAGVPAGADPLWSSFGERSAPGSSWVWQSAVRVQGLDGPAGLSVAEINTYIRSASAPSAPSGGSFNFSSQTLTPPSGWSVGVPSGTDPVYVARGLATTSTPGATVTPTWGGAAAAFSDGQAVDVVFVRSASQPSTPPSSSGAPAGWYGTVADVPAGVNPIWSSFGERSNPASSWVWQSAVQVQGLNGDPGDPGDPGPAGLSVAEINTYIRSASAPSTPSGGSFNFSSQTLTPPSGWSVGVPSGTDPVYVARGLATTSTPGATVTPTWGGSAAAFSDGQAVDVVFVRSASQPSTPPSSSGVPAGWYGTVADVPAGVNPIWSSFGERSNPASSWVWQSAVQVQGLNGDPGDPGDPGPAGLSVAEINTYIRSASAPSTPSGGSFNFSSQTLTPPSGWSVGVPSGTDPVYVARGLATTSTPGATVTPTWGGAAAAFSDGQAVDVVFIRSASQPGTPPPSIGVPSGWYATVAGLPGGSDPVWSSFGERSAPASSWVWQSAVRVQGLDGDQGPQGPRGFPGDTGTSVAEINAYIRSASAPGTPSGGSFNFSTQALTAPSGWNVGVPSGSEPVYVARGLATAATIGATATPTWSTPALAFSDGQSVDAIFIRSASQPSTPAPTFGVPSGWYSTSGSVPGSTDPMWTSFGRRPGPSANWTWEAAVRVEGIDGGDGPQGPQGPRGVAGDAGTSVAELNAYIRAGSEPAAPSGGSFDFSSQALTPPLGWSVGVPGGTEPVYVSRGLATTSTPGASVTPTWGAVAVAFADGQAVDVVFLRSASQPSTPGASAGVPSGWYATVASVPGGADPLWSSFGERASISGNWSWQAPVQVQGLNGATGGVGPAGPPAVSSSLTLLACAFNADSTGLVDGGQTFQTTMQVLSGSTDDTGNWSISRVASDASITTSISGATVQITGMGTALNSGTVTVTATRSGYPTQNIVVQVGKIKRAVPNNGPVTLAGNLEVVAGTLSPADATAKIQLETDGRITGWVNGTSSNIGNWFLANTGGVGSSYEARFDQLSVTGSTAGTTANALASWGALSTARYVQVQYTTNSGTFTQRQYSFAIRRTSDGVQVCSGQVYLECAVEI